MRRLLFALLYLSLLAASCAPQSAPVAADEIPAPVQVTSAHAPEIRFGLIGMPRDVNVWELFDETGASYVDYALRSEYWTRLYRLVPPDFSFQPLAAQGLPTAVVQEGEFYSSTVKLRADLKWTDGSRFTADDVAFTVNTALAFELGFDWRAHYSNEYLDHVKALDAVTVKFIFKKKPNIEVWQYGALQGPVVQKVFWESRLVEAAKLLPDGALNVQIETARAALATVQWDVDELSAKITVLNSAGQGDRQLEIDLAQRQNELNHAQNNLDKLLEEYASKINIAHQALYALDDRGEPTLGAWMFESQKGAVWTNTANPDFPFGKPNFDRAVYHLFGNESDALTAFKKKEVDFILSPNGVSSVKGAKMSPTSSARLLVFNPLKTQFADPAFHAALSCMIDREDLAGNVLQNKAAPLNAFILSSRWHDPKIEEPCTGMNEARRVEYAVNLLKGAGYSWSRQPDAKSAGQGLKNSKRGEFPKIILMTPFRKADALRYDAAKYIAAQAQHLGISISIQEMELNDIVYAVYSSQKYDAALIGWRLGEYPGYICEWFGGENPYLFDSKKFKSACDALDGESNLEAARKSLRQIESRLVTELPSIPLFTVTQAEGYQNLAYPAPGVLNGWSGLYGAPSYAMPSP
jgi:ABC-type transport system substrate-binding protein